MDSPERVRSYPERKADESLDDRREVVVDDLELDGSGKRKHKLSKSKRSSAGENIDSWEISGKRKSSGDRNESRRQSGGSSKGDIDEGDVKKDSSSKYEKKRHESSALEKLSNWYQDGDLENRHDGGDKSGHRSHSRGDDNERNAPRKGSSRFSDREGSHRRSKSKDERSRDGEDEKAIERDAYHSERKEISREKGQGFSEDVKTKRRWDESGTPTKAEDGSITEKSDPKSVSSSDFKQESTCERSTSSRLDTGEGKDRVLETSSDKAKSYSREDRKIDSDKSKIRSRSDAVEEDNKGSPQIREDRAVKEKIERQREVKTSGRDAVDNRDRSSNLAEDGNSLMREKATREVGYSRRSRSPDRSSRLRQDLENSEPENDRSSSLKRKDVEKDGSRDDRVKGRENNWSDRNWEREGSRESWKRRQQAGNDRDIDLVHDHDRERELPRRGRDRMDNDRLLGRPGSRKDGRSEAVKASTNFGISTENYDVIEIQPKPLDYGRDDTNSARRTEAVPLHESKLTMHDEFARTKDDLHRSEGHVTSGDNPIIKNADDSTLMQDHNSWRDDVDGRAGRPRGQQGSFSARPSGGQNSSAVSQSVSTNHEQSSFGRAIQQGPRGNRLGRGGRVRPLGRDNQQVSMPLPLMGSPFGHLGMPPPGPMQPMNPGLSPGPGPPVPPGVFVSPFPPPVWPGNRGFDMSMLPVSPGVSTLPPGPPGQRFPPHMGTPPNPALYFNQPGQGRGMPPNAPGPGYNAIVPIHRVNSNEKSSGGWVPPKSGGPPGKAPSRGEQNDYSQNFVDTGMRPQNFIRELELTNVEDYPKLRELIQKKDEIVEKASTPPMYHKCDLREFTLSPDFFGTKFDVILVDPPWEEYVHRAPGVTDHMEYWTFEDIMNLKIEAIADTPSFIFLWVGDGVGLEQGRQCLKKWGFRRCEDICWVKTNKNSATPALRHDSHTLFQHSKEHCLMGIKGTVRRSTDGHIIHANIDTDVIIAEEPPYGSTAKPEEMYRIIEHFALGRRRLELFGADHNIRAGWLTVGKGLSDSNFDSEAFVRSFADKDGKVWQGGGGRNPPPEAPHLILTTPEIEALRPKSPMKNQQQLQQQQSNSISLTTANSSNRRPAGNSPQNPPGFSLNQEASSSNHPAPWAPPMDAFKGPNENAFDMYGYNIHPVPPPNGEFPDFDPQRMMGMM